jgi:hypothetical protein
MRFAIAAALALFVSVSVKAQSAADLSTAMPVTGTWTYALTSDGSEAVFSNAASPQLWVHCTRANRHVTISKFATAAAPLLSVWTSSLSKDVASSFNPATGRLTIELTNYDPLLDAISNSRGRIGFAIGTQPPLVVPAWAEAAHVIEDCRA